MGRGTPRHRSDDGRHGRGVLHRRSGSARGVDLVDSEIVDVVVGREWLGQLQQLDGARRLCQRLVRLDRLPPLRQRLGQRSCRVRSSPRSSPPGTRRRSTGSFTASRSCGARTCTWRRRATPSTPCRHRRARSCGTTTWALPYPRVDLPCGNISPTVGITSTPVIDTARKEIFVVADELVRGKAHHEFYGLNATTGAVELSQGADPAGADTLAILQRASLTLDGTNVVFGFGGNYGDCSTYHGWVESVPVIGGKARFYKVDPKSGETQGAIWMGGGAPVVNTAGDVWVAAGNGSVSSPSGPYDYSDSVLELSPSMKLLQYFAPSDWYYDNGHDLDLGSSVPAVLERPRRTGGQVADRLPAEGLLAGWHRWPGGRTDRDLRQRCRRGSGVLGQHRLPALRERGDGRLD